MHVMKTLIWGVCLLLLFFILYSRIEGIDIRSLPPKFSFPMSATYNYTYSFEEIITSGILDFNIPEEDKSPKAKYKLYSGMVIGPYIVDLTNYDKFKNTGKPSFDITNPMVPIFTHSIRTPSDMQDFIKTLGSTDVNVNMKIMELLEKAYNMTTGAIFCILIYNDIPVQTSETLDETKYIQRSIIPYTP